MSHSKVLRSRLLVSVVTSALKPDGKPVRIQSLGDEFRISTVRRIHISDILDFILSFSDMKGCPGRCYCVMCSFACPQRNSGRAAKRNCSKVALVKCAFVE